MKIIRGAAQIAGGHPRREITLHTLSQSFTVNVWTERRDCPNPFSDDFDTSKAPPLKLPSETVMPQMLSKRNSVRLELHR